MLDNIKSPITDSIYRSNLKEKISASQKKIRGNISATNSNIIHRTQAINAKRSYQTIEEERAVRGSSENATMIIPNVVWIVFLLMRKRYLI